MNEMPIIITINGKKYVNGVEVKEYKVEKSIGGTRYMCEYCRNRKDYEIKGTEFKLLPTFGFKNDRKYSSWIMKNKMDRNAGIMIATDNSNAVYFNINYCPMCGRKLNEEDK